MINHIGNPRKRRTTNACNAAGNGYAHQSSTVCEGRVADSRDAVADCHARQTGTVCENILADACDAVADGDACQAGAFIEGTPTDARGAVGNGHTRQTGAVIEGVNADARDTVAEGHTRQTGAAAEGIIADTRDAVGNGHARQPGTFAEGIIADTHDAVGDSDFTQIGRQTPQKCCFGGIGVNKGFFHITVHGPRPPRGTACRTVINHVGNSIKRRTANARNAVGNGYTHQSGAVIEGRTTDARDATANLNGFHGLVIRFPRRTGDISAVVSGITVVIHRTRAADSQGLLAFIVKPIHTVAA